MTVAIGIVAQPARRDMAEELAKQVDADLIVVDEDGQGERWCHQEALRRLIKTGADWLVMLEDDALPVDDFLPKLATALEMEPPGIVSAYLGTGRWSGEHMEVHEPRLRAMIDHADMTGAKWITADRLWHAVAVAIPLTLAPAVLAYIENDGAHTDKAIGYWCIETRTPVHYCHPSLVDHADLEPIGFARKAWQL